MLETIMHTKVIISEENLKNILHDFKDKYSENWYDNFYENKFPDLKTCDEVNALYKKQKPKFIPFSRIYKNARKEIIELIARAVDTSNDNEEIIEKVLDNNGKTIVQMNLNRDGWFFNRNLYFDLQEEVVVGYLIKKEEK
jgi:hypothetical protein